MTITLSQLIARCESNDVLHALRYESHFTKYVTPEAIARCRRAHLPAYMNIATASQLLHFSYGLYQIMGQNLYALGYQGNIVDYLKSPTVQQAWFEVFIRDRGINYSVEEIMNDPEKMHKFAVKYNGSANYAETLVSNYRKMLLKEA